MATVQYVEDLTEALSEAQSPGTFASGGAFVPPPIELTIEGIGDIHIPLKQRRIPTVLAACEQAPFGKGAATVIDLAVRKALQIDAAKIILSDAWQARMQQVAAESANALGLNAAALGVRANLYKLVAYQPNGHFKAHKDTEKEPGMFGTVVVQLPVEGCHTGGTLSVRHGGQEVNFAWAGPASATQFYQAAFFGDCEHELHPVTSGLRLCLLYNLVRTTTGLPPALSSVSNDSVAAAIASAVAAWCADTSAQSKPAKLAVKLEHEYTETNLSFAGLKGRDATVATLLRGCAQLDLFLTTIVKQESGSASGGGCDYGWGHKRRRYGYGYDDSDDDDDGEDAVMEEVYDTNISTENWRDIDGNPLAIGSSLSVDIDDELLAVNGEDEDSLWPEDPTSKEYEAYTGNAGPSLEYWYKTALLVIWPKEATMDVVLKADFAGGVRTATSLVDAELESGAGGSSNTAGSRAVHKVTDYYCSRAAVPEPREYILGYGRLPLRDDKLTQVLALCAKLGGESGASCAQRVLKAVAAAGGVQNEAVAVAVAAAVGDFGWAAVGDAVLAAVRATKLDNLASAAALALKLSSLSADKRCRGLAGAAAAAAAAAPVAVSVATVQHVKPELAEQQWQSAPSLPGMHAVKTEQTAAVKLEPSGLPAVKQELSSTSVVKAEPAAAAASAAAPAAVAAPAADARQDGAALVGRYVACLGLGLAIADTASTAAGDSGAASDDDVAVVGVARRHSLSTLTLPQIQTLLTMLLKLSAASGAAAGAAPAVCCQEELALLLARAGEMKIEVLLSLLQSFAARDAVAAALANALAAADWRAMPAGSIATAISVLLQLQKRWSTSDVQQADKLQKALLTRVGQLSAPMLSASLQTVLTSTLRQPSAASVAVVVALADGLVAADWRTLPVDSVRAAVNSVLQLQQQWAVLAATNASNTQTSQAEQIERLQKGLLTRVPHLSAPVLADVLSTVLASTLSSPTAAATEVAVALAATLTAADWRALPAASVAAAVNTLLLLHQRLPALPATTGSQALHTSMLQSAVGAVLRLPSSSLQAALTALLALPALQQAGAGVQLRAAFATVRLRYMVKQCRPVPAFTWHQPQASCPGHPQLEAFFKGPQQTLHRYQGAWPSGIAAARSAASSIMRSFKGCSATATAHGTGRYAAISITKTAAAHSAQVAKLQTQLNQIQQLQAMLPDRGAAVRAALPPEEQQWIRA